MMMMMIEVFNIKNKRLENWIESSSDAVNVLELNYSLFCCSHFLHGGFSIAVNGSVSLAQYYNSFMFAHFKNFLLFFFIAIVTSKNGRRKPEFAYSTGKLEHLSSSGFKMPENLSKEG